MKKIITYLINNILLKPIKVEYCSQTIYQTLLGCIRMWESTFEEKWKIRAQYTCNLLIKIQRPDGGFDIGYDFNFGRLHKKGESTSPELYGLIALTEFYKHFPTDDVKIAASKAANWIKNNSIQLKDAMWAIPYAPSSIKSVMVYNGTSFASSALAHYLSIFPNEDLKVIYDGMNKYLYYSLRSELNKPGKFWYYSEQERKDLTEMQRSKIDYYHQMQQVEVHSLAEISNFSPFQKDIICLATTYICNFQDSNGLIPYTNLFKDYKDGIQLWGYCSCASGFILASKICPEKKDEYLKRAELILEWIAKYGWNGSYFYRILSKYGKPIDKKFYVRSDAWVFNSYSLAVKEGYNKYIDLCEKSFDTIKKSNFTSIENHASNNRIRIVRRILDYLYWIKRKI